MEFGPPTNPETKKDTDTEDSKDKKKKTTGTGRAAIQAESAPVAPPLPEAGQRRDTVVESIWQKIKGESAKPKQAEVPLFGIKKPELANKLDTTADRIGDRPDLIANLPSDAGDVDTIELPAMVAEIDETTSADESAELHAAANDFAELRQKAADGELHDLPLDQHDSPHAAAAAADMLLMRAVQENLQDPSKPVGEALDAAEQRVTETIAAAGQAEENIGENAGEPGDSEAVPDNQAEALPVLEMVPETSVDQPPEPPPTPPVPPVGPPIGPLYGPGGTPPHFGHNATPPATFEAAPHIVPVATPNVVPLTRDYGGERAATARGLLVGAVVGYFGGRHRGRKQGAARAEKQFTPVRRNFEKQVKNLQETITAKESHIRQVAREKVSAMNQSQERKRVIDRLVRPAETMAAAETTTAVAHSTVAPEAVVAFAPPMGEVYSRAAQADGATSTEVLINQRYGQEAAPAGPGILRTLAEAPLAAVAGLAAGREQAVSQVAVHEQAAPGQVSREQAAVIPFNKKAEDFSKAELMQTAEKVKVEGVSLKEMAELGRLDEPALRRVVGEFLEGGNVSAAVARETKEKDIKYERDPSLRQPAGSSQPGGGGAGGNGAAVTNDQTVAAASAPGSQNQQASPDASYSGPAPTPDAATLKAVRDKQLAAVTTGTVVVALIILILALLIR